MLKRQHKKNRIRHVPKNGVWGVPILSRVMDEMKNIKEARIREIDQMSTFPLEMESLLHYMLDDNPSIMLVCPTEEHAMELYEKRIKPKP